MRDALPSPLARWVLAARPKTLPMALAPVLAGLGLALAEDGAFAPLIALITLLAATAIQIGTNLYNDAADFERGTDTAERLGPARASAEGWFSATTVKRAAHLAFALAFGLGIVLLVRGGWPILLIGLASLAGGYAYTGGPRPISRGPFGELFVVLFFGLAAVGGTYYLQRLAIDASALLAGLALGLPAAAVLLVNNYRDLDTDRRAGRRTLCHYLERPRARWLYAALLVLAPLLLMLAPLPGQGWPLVLALPLAVALAAALWRATPGSGEALNRLLARTALYQSALTLLLLLGLAL